MIENSDVKGLTQRFINFITFVDLPIKKKFLLFSIGVLFWFVILFAVIMGALAIVNNRTGRIVHNMIPHDRVAQKIVKNLQSLELDAVELSRIDDVKGAVRRIEVSKARLEDIKSYLAALDQGGKINDYSRDSGTLIEAFVTSSVKGDIAGEKYLQDMSALYGSLVKMFKAIAELKTEDLYDNAHGNGGLDAQLRDYQQALSAAVTVSNEYSVNASTLYTTSADRIESVVYVTSAVVACVLLISLALLAIFTNWISKSIANPVKSIIDQIHSLGTGDVDLTKKIAINSKDEIGVLSSEFNGLMESIHGMTIFKKVIEEDESLEDVYSRLGNAFSEQVGIGKYMIYEVDGGKNKINPVYPLLLSDGETFCSADIYDNSELCKARKTGHLISSLAYPRICKHFPSESGMEHSCIPMIVGGSTGGVVQLLFNRADPDHADPQAANRKVFKATQYIKESLSVIEAKRLMNTLRDSALKDALTGLYNRRFLQEYTESLVAGVLRREKNIGLIMCDLDYFKQVNDVYGHNAGDAILKETSSLIRNTVRLADLVIRFGGEEFLVVLLDVNKDETVNVAEKIRENMQNAKLKVPDGVLKKTISLGISEFPKDTQSFWQAIKFADVALYKAKETGRNKSVRFTEEMWTGEQF